MQDRQDLVVSVDGLAREETIELAGGPDLLLAEETRAQHHDASARVEQPRSIDRRNESPTFNSNLSSQTR